jgi:hypothetical protein
MTDKKSFVAEQLKANPEINQLELSRKVRETYGKGLSFVHVRQLRDAWGKGSFDRVWHELFGLEEATEQSAAPARQKKSRGERRRKTQLRGRRDLDRDKIVMRDFSNHLVVYRTHDGTMHSQAFKSRDRAERMVNELLSEGVPANEIGYFKRNEIQAKVVL